ncbi:hypothetical protein ACFL1H_03545 [Nanoarchaeota archaeon]
MSESGDYDPGPWRGHDFKENRKKYDKHVGRSYNAAQSANKKGKDLLYKNISTKSKAPVVIACDVTGSMGDWPATIFSKLPYLDLEGKEYLGKDMEISFAAVGDAYSDRYPLQVRKFCSGKNLEKRLEELVIEGNGGSPFNESYDLAALYYTKNCDMPNAIKPIFIFIGDEGLYDFIDKKQAKDWCYTTFKDKLSTEDVMKDLMTKYSVYLIRKPYNQGSGNQRSPVDETIYNQWESMLGGDHISILPAADRVVDVIFGIFAKETNRIPYFEEEITDRQRPDQVKQVLESLHNIHNGPRNAGKKKKGQSKLHKKQTGEKVKSLL